MGSVRERDSSYMFLPQMQTHGLPTFAAASLRLRYLREKTRRMRSVATSPDTIFCSVLSVDLQSGYLVVFSIFLFHRQRLSPLDLRFQVRSWRKILRKAPQK